MDSARVEATNETTFTLEATFTLPESDQLARRNAITLAAAQSVVGAANPVVISLGGLAGLWLLADNPALATLPVSSFGVGLALGTLPAAWLMERVGRRIGFLCGTAIGFVGFLGAAGALVGGFFWMFCLALLIAGSSVAFVQQYRFAAADEASALFRPRAISWVLAGGLGAAIIGPQTAIATQDILAPVPFAGAFVAAALFMFPGALILSRLRFTQPPARHAVKQGGRPLGQIVRSRAFLVAVFCGVSSYALMSLVMTGTPLAMVHAGHSHEHAMLGIQWHVLAMYAPSFFTGSLIVRFGKKPIVGTGLFVLALCAVAGLTGIELWNFWSALILLGVGWNFAFLGATAMLTETHNDAEKSRVQGLNDFLIFGSVALASLSSGQIFNSFGGQALFWVILPVVALSSLLLITRPSARNHGSSV